MNPYTELDVPKDADLPTIKKAYRKKASAAHPDKSGGDGSKMASLNRALEILEDPARRGAYDQTGQDSAGKTPADEAGQLLKEVLSGCLKAPKGKYLSLARGKLMQFQAEVAAQTPQIEELRKQLTDRRSKVKHNGNGPNIAHMVIDAELDRTKGALGMAAHKQAVLKLALAALDAYECAEVEDIHAGPSLRDGFGTIIFTNTR